MKKLVLFVLAFLAFTACDEESTQQQCPKLICPQCPVCNNGTCPKCDECKEVIGTHSNGLTKAGSRLKPHGWQGEDGSQWWLGMYDTKLDDYCFTYDSKIYFGCDFSYCIPHTVYNNYYSRKIIWHNDYNNKDIPIDYCEEYYNTDPYLSLFEQEHSEEETIEERTEKARQKRKEICANVCDVIEQDAKDGDWVKIKRVVFD